VTAPVTCDVAVVGGGAAGLAAAIFAAEARAVGGVRPSIVLLDGAARLGAKILVSGGGRCNVTNAEVRPDDFNGRRPVVRNVLAAFGVEATVRWFERLGVRLKREETGKLFPVSDRARTVLDALLGRCAALEVAVLAGHRVHGITPTADGFTVAHGRGTLTAGRVIMATGGRSLPRTGSDGSGWTLLQALGHSVTPTYPALVPLVLRPGGFHAELSGVSHPAELSTYVAGRRIDRRTGSLLWTHFGVSGPVVLDASRHWVIANARGERPELRCSVVPGESLEAVERRLMTLASDRPRLSLLRALAERLPDRVAATLAAAAGVDAATSLGQLSRAHRRALAQVLTALVLPVERARGWDYAEVTAGGVPLDEIDYRTMASRRVPGLYLCGELLDCDGRIGGFNFQWAWATGHLAGRAAVDSSGWTNPSPH